MKQNDYDRIQADNQRLTTLLSRMGGGVYSELIEDMHDTSQEGGMAYVAPAQKRNRLNSVAKKSSEEHFAMALKSGRGFRSKPTPSNPSSECGYWVPAAVYNLASTFQTYYVPECPMSHVLELLAAMNKAEVEDTDGSA
mmetsp:Transcript_11425/g.13540  ORF Transcript_11425/g.13540 Transcript_11425/m.13540 type:complete len:139 (-) Transcript_11425:10-426(-)